MSEAAEKFAYLAAIVIQKCAPLTKRGDLFYSIGLIIISRKEIYFVNAWYILNSSATHSDSVILVLKP